jgi:hypothetical protein
LSKELDPFVLRFGLEMQIKRMNRDLDVHVVFGAYRQIISEMLHVNLAGR